MRAFVRLCGEIEQSQKPEQKIQAIARYLRTASPADAAWVIHLLLGRRPKRSVSLIKLKEWTIAASGYPTWIVDECNRAAGDWTETLALILPPPSRDHGDLSLSVWLEDRILPLATQYESVRRGELLSAWEELDGEGRGIYNRLVTGTFRISVVKDQLTKAISLASGISPAAITHRLAGHWEPTASFYERLSAPESFETDRSRPLPYMLGSPLVGGIGALGDRSNWLAEWKWEGLRAQVIRRGGGIYVWSRNHDLVNDQFPEVAGMACLLPDGVVLDGMILPWKLDAPLQSAELQRRLGRKIVTKRLLAEVPITFIAFDILELNGEDLRSMPLTDRRRKLAEVVREVADESLRLSPHVEAHTWEALTRERESSRGRHVGGVVLKRLAGRYIGGRRSADWWKWNPEPLTIDAVLMYATRGSDPLGPSYSDYTFGVWADPGQLISIGKVAAGLTDGDRQELDQIIRATTIERFGPVRTVTPSQVMRISFHRVVRSTRHKCGLVLSYPQITGWTRNRTIESAATLEQLRRLADPS